MSNTHTELRLFRVHAAKQTKRLGSWDCCLMCADWFLRCRGEDPARNLRGRYATERDTDVLVSSFGGMVPMFEQMLEPLGAMRIPKAMAAEGDIVITESRTYGLQPGIVFGSMVMMAADTRGIFLRRMDIEPLVAAWRF